MLSRFVISTVFSAILSESDAAKVIRLQCHIIVWQQRPFNVKLGLVPKMPGWRKTLVV